MAYILPGLGMPQQKLLDIRTLSNGARALRIYNLC